MKTFEKKTTFTSSRQARFMLGLGLASAITLIAFEWRSFELLAPLIQFDKSMDDNTYRVYDKFTIVEPEIPKVPEPPSRPVAQRITDEMVLVDNHQENTTDATKLENKEGLFDGLHQIPIQGEIDILDDPVTFVIVEDMPVFPGCEKTKTYEERMQCMQEKMTGFLQQHLRYPERDKQLGIQGDVYVSFVVGSDGKVCDVTLLQGISSGCDQEAARVISKLPLMKPGKQRGVPVRVQFTQKIRFSLK